MAGKRGAAPRNQQREGAPGRSGSSAQRIRRLRVIIGVLVPAAVIVVGVAYAYGRWQSMADRPGATSPGVSAPQGNTAPDTASTAARLDIAGDVATSQSEGAPGSIDPVRSATSAQGTSDVRRLRLEVLSTRPHDPSAFTQGLLLDDGRLYESTGMYGQSTLREVDPGTGDVLRSVDLAPDLFGEGLAMVDDTLVQLTWRSGIALRYGTGTFTETARHSYEGEGWGLCFDGERLVMSNGSSDLTVRDPSTFEPIATVPVTLRGEPVPRLNELECVGDVVYANVWQTDTIVAVDAASGHVRAVIDASSLLTAEERAGADVLNGIAYDPVRETFLITGKWWPKLFEVRFVPARQTYLPGIVAGF